MLYALLIHAPDAYYEKLPPAELDQLLGRFFALKRRMQEAGVFRGGEHLKPAASATTVRLAEGRLLITDGPFAETKEQFGGLVLIDVPDLDQALAWARQVPAIEYGSIEVRPAWEHPEYRSNPDESSMVAVSASPHTGPGSRP